VPGDPGYAGGMKRIEDEDFFHGIVLAGVEVQSEAAVGGACVAKAVLARLRSI
jgi:hypothetical protein